MFVPMYQTICIRSWVSAHALFKLGSDTKAKSSVLIFEMDFTLVKVSAVAATLAGTSTQDNGRFCMLTRVKVGVVLTDCLEEARDRLTH